MWTVEQTADVNPSPGGTTETATATATYGATPTAGNDLICLAIARPNNVAGAAPTLAVASGGNSWTQIRTESTDNHTIGVFHRVAGVSESTSVVITPADSGDTIFNIGAVIYEVSGPSPFAATPDVNVGAATMVNAATIGVSTGTLTTPGQFMVGIATIRNGGETNDTNWDTPTTGTVGVTQSYGSSLDCENYSVVTGYVEQWDTAAQTWSASTLTAASRAIIVVGWEPENYNTIATDDFNRANETLNTSANWGAWLTESSIVSNTVQGASSDTNYGSKWVGTFSDDQWAECDVTIGTNFSVGGPAVRCSGDDGYYAGWTTADSGTYQISRITNGAYTQLAGVTGVGASGTRKLRLEAIGSVLCMYVDGVLQLTTTNTLYATGNAGFYQYQFSGTTTQIDNFSAGDWTDPAGTLRFYPADNYGQQAGSPTTVSNLHWNAGDIIVTMAGGADATNPLLISSLPTNANLTFTNLGTLDSSNYSDARFDYAIATTTESFQTISQVFTANYTGIVAWVYTPLSPGSAVIREVASKFNDETTETLNVADNSIVLYGNVDWNASSADKTLATGSGTATEHADDYIPVIWGWVFGDWVGTTAGATAFGLASYSGLASSQMFVEISERNTIATDDFNRANETLSASANWTSTDDASHAISGNVVVGTSGAGVDHTTVYVGTTFADDQWAQTTASGLTDTGNDLGLVIRHSDSAKSGYRASWSQAGGGTYELEREDAGADTVLATAKTGVGTTGPRTLRLEAIGSVISFYVDGVLQLEATDTTYTSGYPGIFSDYASTTDSHDNFSAGDWSVPASNVTIDPVGSSSSSSSDIAQLTASYLPMTVNPVKSTSSSSSDTAQLSEYTVTFAFTEGAYAENNPTVTPTAPSGSGGILVAIIHRQNGGTVAWNTPGDWTLIDSNLTGWAYNSIERYYTYAANPDLQINYNFADVGVHLYRITGASGPPHAEFDLFWLYPAASGAQTMPDVVGAPRGVAIASFAADGFSSDQLPDSFSLGWTVDKNSTWSSGSGVGSTSLHIDHSTTGTFDPGTATFDTTSSCTLGLLIIPTSTNEIATDDFNRADGGLGSNWSLIDAGVLAISSNEATISSPLDGTDGIAIWNKDCFHPNQWVEADVSISGTATSADAGLIVRGNLAADNGYKANWENAVGGTYKIMRTNNGADTVLASVNGVGTTGTRRIRLEAVGDYPGGPTGAAVITLFVDGVEVLTIADTSVTEPTMVSCGYPGFKMDKNDAVSPVIDNWAAGDWASQEVYPVTLTHFGDGSFNLHTMPLNSRPKSGNLLIASVASRHQFSTFSSVTSGYTIQATGLNTATSDHCSIFTAIGDNTAAYDTFQIVYGGGGDSAVMFVEEWHSTVGPWTSVIVEDSATQNQITGTTGSLPDLTITNKSIVSQIVASRTGTTVIGWTNTTNDVQVVYGLASIPAQIGRVVTNTTHSDSWTFNQSDTSLGAAAIAVRVPDAPTSDPITDYLIEYRTTSGPGVWTLFSDGVSALTGATVTGLTPGISYDFRVSAVNSAGAGAWSNIATAVATTSGTVYLKLGDSGVSAMKLGDATVGAAYLGDVQIL